jgi:hypothetical protein
MTSILSHLNNALHNTWHNSGELKEDGVRMKWNGGEYQISLPDAHHRMLIVNVKNNSSADLKMDKKTKHIIHNLATDERSKVNDSIAALKKTIVVFHGMRQTDHHHSKDHVLQTAETNQSTTIRNLAQTILQAKTTRSKEEFSCTTNVEKKKNHGIKVTAEGSLNGVKGTLILKKKGEDVSIKSKLSPSSDLYKKLKAEAEKKV